MVTSRAVVSPPPTTRSCERPLSDRHREYESRDWLTATAAQRLLMSASAMPAEGRYRVQAAAF
jgi:hypothetical protein